MGQRSKEAWNEVGERFASWTSRLSAHYTEAGSAAGTDDVQRKLKEAARQIGRELDRAFGALDDTLRDGDAKEDLRSAVGAIGTAMSATIDDAAAAIRQRGSSDAPPPARPDEDEPPDTA